MRALKKCSPLDEGLGEAAQQHHQFGAASSAALLAATTKLGRAVQLASEAGNDATTKLLAQVVEIDNAETGTVRLKRDAEVLDVMALDTRSTKTTRVRPAGTGAATPPDGGTS